MSFTIPNTFATRTGSIQLSLLDDNFTYLINSLGTLETNLNADIDSISLYGLSQTATNLSGVGGVLDNILPSGETSGYVLTTSGAGTYYWAGAVASASANGVIYENSTTISSNYTLSTGKNGMSVGPVTIGSGVTVTVPSGQRWVIL